MPPPVKKVSQGLAEYLRSRAQIEKGFQAGILFLLQGLYRPLGQGIARFLSFRFQTVGIQSRKLFIQRRDEFKIMCQRTQLGRAAEFEFDAFIEIKRGGKIIRLYAYQVSFRGGLHQ